MRPFPNGHCWVMAIPGISREGFASIRARSGDVEVWDGYAHGFPSLEWIALRVGRWADGDSDRGDDLYEAFEAYAARVIRPVATLTPHLASDGTPYATATDARNATVRLEWLEAEALWDARDLAQEVAS